MDTDEFKASPFYTNHMAQKHEAIHRYLVHNLATEEQALKLFEDFVDKNEMTQ